MKQPIRFSLTFILLVLCLLGPACRVRTEPQENERLRVRIVELARSLCGLNYSFGGTDINGFDCSGLVHYVYSCYGIELPRTAKEQMTVPRQISLKRIKPGDIIVFRLPRTWHSVVYIGDGRFVHAPSRNSRVREEILNDYWQSRLRKVVSVLSRR